MIRTMTLVRQYVAASLIVSGLIASGCGDTASVNSSAELASLAVDPGSLEPAFSGGTTQYTVNLSNSITSVTITAQPAVSGDTVTINGQNATSSVIALDEAGTTTSVSIVVSGSGANPGGYTVRFVRAGLTGNNSLQNLTVSPGVLAPDFDENVQSYTVDVANTVGSIRVTPTLSDPAATMTVNGQPTDSGQARTITLNPAGQDTAIPIVVTAQNNSTNRYIVTVSREVSGNNNLSGLTISPGSLSPRFTASRTSYTASIDSDDTRVTVTATAANSNARLTINGQETRSRPITLGPPGSSTAIFIVVTAQNGTQKTYTVDARRDNLSGNNNLSSLTVSSGSLSPGFAASRTSYTTSADSDDTSVTVSATKSDSTAVMAIGSVTVPAGTRTGQATVTLGGQGSDTPVSITVTAPSGSPKTYHVTIHRDEIAVPRTPTVAPDLISEDDSCLRDSVTNLCLPPTSDSDNITNVTTPRFRIPQPGTGETPNLRVDGNNVGETFDRTANILRPAQALSEGEHTITYTLTNAGGTSSPSPSLTVEIDTVVTPPGGGP